MIEPKTILAVLLVEDSDDDAELIRRQVCAVWPVSRLHTVGTLHDAALFLDKSQPDVILLDLNLPNGAGVKIVKMIRAIADSALLLVVSVRADLHTAEEAIRNEADGYISKDNITPCTLSLAIAVAVAHRERENAKIEAVRKLDVLALTEQQKIQVRGRLDKVAELNAGVNRRINESMGILNAQV